MSHDCNLGFVEGSFGSVTLFVDEALFVDQAVIVDVTVLSAST